MGQMTSLAKFFCDNNGHSGTLPSELSGLSNLKLIKAKVNKFTGTLPPMPATVNYLDFRCDSEFVHASAMGSVRPVCTGSP